MSKLIKTTVSDITVNTSTTMVVEIGELTFEVDERFPWIKVFKRTDDSWENRKYITEIDEDDMPIFVSSEESFNELKRYCLNWYFNNVEIVSDEVACTKTEE